MIKSGNIWSWGSGKNGELGSGFLVDTDSPKEIISNYPMWSKIWSGGPGDVTNPKIGYNLAINISSELYFWGALYDDPVSAMKVSLPYASGMSFVPTRIGTKSDWVTCSVGRGGTTGSSFKMPTHAMAIDSVGDLYAWGYNSYGQLGDGTGQSKTDPVKIGENYADISCGVNCTLGLKQNGDVYFWGRKGLARILTPQLVYSDTGYTKISIGYSCSIGLKNNGDVYAWDLLGVSNTPLLVSSNCKFIDAGRGSVVVIKENGDLYEWKSLIVNNKNITFERDSELLGSSYDSVSIGFNHSLALKENGDLYGWGYSKNGELGYKSSSNALPVADPIKIDEGYFCISAGPAHSIGIKESAPIPTPTPVCDLSILAQNPIAISPGQFYGTENGGGIHSGSPVEVWSFPGIRTPGYGLIFASSFGINIGADTITGAGGGPYGSSTTYFGDSIYLCGSEDYYIPNKATQIHITFVRSSSSPGLQTAGYNIFFENYVNDVVVLISGLILGAQYKIFVGDWKSVDKAPNPILIPRPIGGCPLIEGVVECPEHPGPLDDPDYSFEPVDTSNDINLITIEHCNVFVHENRVTGASLYSAGDIVLRINSSQNYRRIEFSHSWGLPNNDESQPALSSTNKETSIKVAILPSCENLITPTPTPTADCPVCEKINCEINTDCVSNPVAWTIGEVVLNRKCNDGGDYVSSGMPNFKNCRGGDGTWHVIDRWTSWRGDTRSFSDNYINPCCTTETLTVNFGSLFVCEENCFPQPAGSIVDGVIENLPSSLRHPYEEYNMGWFLLVKCQ
jgi:hypothetical protein